MDSSGQLLTGRQEGIFCLIVFQLEVSFKYALCLILVLHNVDLSVLDTNGM